MSQLSAPRPAVFLDRDGTIIEETNYLRCPSQIRLIDGASQALRRLREAGFCIIVVTNQSGVARGYFTEPDVQLVHEKLTELLAADGALLDGIYYCPHHPDAGEPPYRKDCDCRKPKPGMLVHAARELNIQLDRSFMVGDKASDLQAGKVAGTKSILVRTGYGTLHEQQCPIDYDHVADTVNEASDWILRS